jgi:hypothetical protein
MRKLGGPARAARALYNFSGPPFRSVRLVPRKEPEVDKRFALPVLVGLLLMLSGCSLFKISDGSKEIRGIPFYPKVGKLKQTTVWSRTWLEIGFTLSDVDPPTGKKSNTQSGVLQVDEKTGTADNLNNSAAAAQLAAKTQDLGRVIEAFKKGSSIVTITLSTITSESDAQSQGNPSSLLQTLVSNGTELVTEVDYSKTYYYNAQVPIFSSAEASVKLAADGSLSEVSAKADTTKLADVIPVGGLLSKAFGLTASSGDTTTTSAFAPTVANRELVITISRKGYIYTLTKLLSPDSLRRQAPVMFGYEDSIVRSALGDDAGKKDDKSKKATFEGSLTLPEKQ